MNSYKSEIRRPKAEGRIGALHSEASSQLPCGISDFGFRVSFGLRISDFGFRAQVARAFTLIELILVMAILTMAVSVTAPTLSHFFRGRTLDAEARRILALTHSGQNRAVSEGIPIDLWVDANQGRVGLDAEPSFETSDSRAVEFDLDAGVQIEAVKNNIPTTTLTPVRSPLHPQTMASVPRVNLTHSALPTIRFLPDGSVSETSPQSLRLTGRDGVSLWVSLGQDKLSYEIRRTDQ